MGTTGALLTAVSIGALVGAVLAAVGAALVVNQVRGELRKFVSAMADREALATQIAADRLRATEVAVDRLAAAVAGSQGWFWSPEWQEGEREVEEDLAEGRYTRFSSVEEMDAALDKVPSHLAASR